MWAKFIVQSCCGPYLTHWFIRISHIGLFYRSGFLLNDMLWLNESFLFSEICHNITQLLLCNIVTQY